MIKKITFLILVPIILIVIDSCCGDTSTYYFTWNNIELHNMVMEYQNEYDWIEYGHSSDTVFQKATYGFSIHFIYELLAFNKGGSFSLIQSAYATSCDRDDYLLQDRIEKIEIRTLRDFDISHRKDDIVTDFFKVVWWGKFIEVNEGLNGTNGINENRHWEDQLDTEYCLYLNKNPELDSLVQFKVNIFLDSGTILSDTTKLVRIIE